MRSLAIGADDGGFEYDLCQIELVGHPNIYASRVEWRAQIDGSAREVLGEAEAATPAGGSAANAAKAFLSAILSDGPVPVAEIKAHADGAGQSWASVRRAKDALGIEARKSGFADAGVWVWELPSLRCSKVFKGAQEKEVSTLGNFEHLSATGDEEVEI